MIAGRINQVATRKGHGKLNVKEVPPIPAHEQTSPRRKTKAAAVYKIVCLRERPKPQAFLLINEVFARDLSPKRFLSDIMRVLRETKAPSDCGTNLSTVFKLIQEHTKSHLAEA